MNSHVVLAQNYLTRSSTSSYIIMIKKSINYYSCKQSLIQALKNESVGSSINFNDSFGIMVADLTNNGYLLAKSHACVQAVEVNGTVHVQPKVGRE